MTTVERRPPTAEDSKLERARRVNAWLVGAVIILGAALVGLGIWLMVELEADGNGESAEIVDQWKDAFLDGDPDAVATLFTEDGVYEERGPTQIFEGRSAIRRQLQEGFQYADATVMTPNTVITADSIMFGANDVIAVEWTMRGISASDDRVSTDKTPFSVEAVTLFEMKDGLISRSVFYASWDDLFN